jgi:signal transduction histidine kinase
VKSKIVTVVNAKITSKLLGQNLLIFTAYFITAKIGLSLDPVSGFASLVWAPSGIALAGMLTCGYLVAPSIFAAAFLVNFITGAPPVFSLAIAIGNTLEIITANYLLSSVSFRNSLDRLQDAWNLIFLGGIVSPIIAATIGTTSLVFAKITPNGISGEMWLAWWVGDMLGIILFTPLILVWVYPQKNQISYSKALELLAVIIIFLFTVWILLSGYLGSTARAFRITYIIFPTLIWLSLRFSQKEVISVIFLLYAISIYDTLHGAGIFVGGRLLENLFYLQSFIGITAATFLLFSSAMAERNNLEQRKNEFISIASHELRTPLTGLKGYIQILQQMVTDNKQKNHLARMDDQVNRLTNLITQMLDSSRIGEGKMNLNFEIFSLTELLDETIDDKRKLSKSHQFQFTKKPSVFIEADKYRIRQVFENLLNNAVKFSPPKSKIVIELTSEKDHAIISVRDFGIGIDEKYQKELFSRFFQTGEAKRNTSEGLGLGLYISAAILKLHNGQIWVRSRKGRGSNFFVQLPLRKSQRIREEA